MYQAQHNYNLRSSKNTYLSTLPVSTSLSVSTNLLNLRNRSVSRDRVIKHTYNLRSNA